MTSTSHPFSDVASASRYDRASQFGRVVRPRVARTSKDDLHSAIGLEEPSAPLPTTAGIDLLRVVCGLSPVEVDQLLAQPDQTLGPSRFSFTPAKSGGARSLESSSVGRTVALIGAVIAAVLLLW